MARRVHCIHAHSLPLSLRCKAPLPRSQIRILAKPNHNPSHVIYDCIVSVGRMQRIAASSFSGLDPAREPSASAGRYRLLLLHVNNLQQPRRVLTPSAIYVEWTLRNAGLCDCGLWLGQARGHYFLTGVSKSWGPHFEFEKSTNLL